MFDAFLSHTDADRDAALALDATLRERGLTPWIDVRDAVPGRSEHMLLHLADALLERTRLHLAFEENAEARVHLDAASDLVERCGYGRRRPDVEFLGQKLLREG